MAEISEDEFCNSLYGEIQDGGSCGWYVRQSHKSLEKGFKQPASPVSVLEIGCNLGEHTEFVKHPYDRYVASDYRTIDFVPPNPRVTFQVADAQNLPFTDNSFERVIMTCVLHHLAEPERATREMRRVTKPSGTISILVPTDPGIAYRLGKRIGPYRALKNLRTDIQPEYFHYRQHRNHFPGLASIIEEVYSYDTIRRLNWPIPWRIWNLNLYRIYQIKVNK